MTGLDRNQTPKTRPMAQKRTALVASLDIGTSKIACMIARLKPCPPNDALRGRSHAVELIGYSQIQSRGVKWPNAWPRSGSNPCCSRFRAAGCMVN